MTTKIQILIATLLAVGGRWQSSQAHLELGNLVFSFPGNAEIFLHVDLTGSIVEKTVTFTEAWQLVRATHWRLATTIEPFVDIDGNYKKNAFGNARRTIREAFPDLSAGRDSGMFIKALNYCWDWSSQKLDDLAAEWYPLSGTDREIDVRQDILFLDGSCN